MAQIYIVWTSMASRAPGQGRAVARVGRPRSGSDKLCISSSTAAALFSSLFISSAKCVFEKDTKQTFVAQNIYENVDIEHTSGIRT